MKFVKTATDPQSSARCGVITTDHGEIETPIFMPVGTVGSVKGIYHRDLKEDIKAEILSATERCPSQFQNEGGNIFYSYHIVCVPFVMRGTHRLS